MIALDSSAVTKLVVREAETPALQRALLGRRLVGSALLGVEVLRAVRRVDESLLPQAEAVLGALALVRVDEEILATAARLAPASLRSLDAVHLASALLLGDELTSFCTYDTRQAEAAGALGLTVVSPR